MNQYSAKSLELVNFCRAPLTRHVECSCVCADSYQVENLISQDVSQRSRGFRVERFIRPPVHIVLHFLAPVDVACVLMRPEFADEGSEMSVTVFTASQSTVCHQEMSPCGRGSVQGVGAVLVMKNRAFERRHGLKVELSSHSGVLASNLTYTDSGRTSEEQQLKDARRVKCLRLSVNYFSGVRPVSLKWVEVWGKVGDSRHREEVSAALADLRTIAADGFMSVYNVNLSGPSGEDNPMRCFELVTPPGAKECCGKQELASVWSRETKNKANWVAASHQTNNKAGPSVDYSVIEETCNTIDRVRNEKVALPDRFLDEITCELMTLPMLLPSGHCVDRSTLDKLHHTDSIYGRAPSDPFTGVAFSEHVQPQFSVELKQQIDSFLSRHRTAVPADESSTCLSSLGRTLGSASDIASHLASIETAPAAGQKKRARSEGVGVFLPAAKKSNLTAADGGENSSKGIRLSDEQSLSLIPPPLTSNSSISVEASKEKACSTSHELEIASSLDRELCELLHTN